MLVHTVSAWSELLVLGLGRVGSMTAKKAKPLMNYTALVHDPVRPNEISWDDTDRIQEAARSCSHLLVALPYNMQTEICQLVV